MKVGVMKFGLEQTSPILRIAFERENALQRG